MKTNRYLLSSTLVAALGSFLFGFDTAVISGTTEALRQVFQLSSGQLGFTVASALVGTILGSLLAGKPAELLGRKRTLTLLALFYFVSSLGCGLAWNWISLLAFRFMGGIAIGVASVVSPMYIAEIAPPASRGRLVAVSQFNTVLGILVAYFTNYVIASIFAGPEAAGALVAWRWMFGILAAPSVVFFFLVLRIPESPRWLVKQHRPTEALDVLRRLGNADSEQLIREISESLREETVRTHEPFYVAKYRKPILLAIMVATFNQLSGINALIYYTADIFRMAGAERASALLQSVIIGVACLVATALAMGVIDRFGRKKLLLTGAAGMAFCLAITAFAFYQRSGGRVVLASLIGYIGFFAFSQGSVIWVFLSEIFPNRVRARGQALGSFVHWLWCAVVSWTFPIIAEQSGGHAFLFFSLMMILQLAMVAKLLPETKGVSLEQIQRTLGIE
ncbi:MAG: sugar porter family MFS transporter [Acidimicrobiia bacterium]|nr:sugar porter family MFS transporter [Acidimicrobiia bacterium]